MFGILNLTNSVSMSSKSYDCHDNAFTAIGNDVFNSMFETAVLEPGLSSNADYSVLIAKSPLRLDLSALLCRVPLAISVIM